MCVCVCVCVCVCLCVYVRACVPVCVCVCVPANMEQFLLAARDVIPTLRGIKFSDNDLVQMCACLRTKDVKGRNFNILYGTDEVTNRLTERSSSAAITLNVLAILDGECTVLANTF